MLGNNFTLWEEKSEDNHSFPIYQSEEAPAAHEKGKGNLFAVSQARLQISASSWIMGVAN